MHSIFIVQAPLWLTLDFNQQYLFIKAAAFVVLFSPYLLKVVGCQSLVLCYGVDHFQDIRQFVGIMFF